MPGSFGGQLLTTTGRFGLAWVLTGRLVVVAATFRMPPVRHQAAVVPLEWELVFRR